jgi:crossover junction endodeoxyribonuclease RuvC
MLVMGIDPGLTTTGYGLVRGGGQPQAVAAGVIRTEVGRSTAERLRVLHDQLLALLRETAPDVVAIEQVFTNANRQTAAAVGRASGVALLAAAEAGLAVFEYTPTGVKAAVAGDGAADKRQVSTMVARRLRLAEPPSPADAADALAVALCHLQTAFVEVRR